MSQALWDGKGNATQERLRSTPSEFQREQGHGLGRGVNSDFSEKAGIQVKFG